MLPYLLKLCFYQLFFTQNIHAELTGTIHHTSQRLLQSKCCSTINSFGATHQSPRSKVQTLPFKVKGPKRLDDKIAIIGAGTSGIHMALLLKERGFTDVHILEKTNDLGGKLKTVNYRGAPQELGGAAMTPDYEEVIELANRYVPNDLVHLIPSSVWLDGLQGPITYGQYVGGFLMKLLGTNNVTVISQAIFSDICRYNTLHRLFFGDYEQEIMPEPSDQVRSHMQVTSPSFDLHHDRNL